MKWAWKPPVSRPTRALAAASLVACALVGLRVVLTGEDFLVWMPSNLFLASVPYGIAIVIRRLARARPHGSGLLVAPTVAWLLFFPNAPYVLTDFVHLHAGSASRFAYDAVLLAYFTAVCLALGLASLHIVHTVVRDRLGARAGWAFVATVSMLAGVGVWMGRVLRWNSWDVVGRPRELLTTTIEAVLHPWNHAGAFIFSAAFGLGLLAAYILTVRRASMRI